MIKVKTVTASDAYSLDLEIREALKDHADDPRTLGTAVDPELQFETVLREGPRRLDDHAKPAQFLFVCHITWRTNP
jgi:hypothetical protein